MMILDFTNDYSIFVFGVVVGSVTTGLLVFTNHLLHDQLVDNKGVQTVETNVQHVDVQPIETKVDAQAIETNVDVQAIEINSEIQTVENTLENTLDIFEENIVGIQTDSIQNYSSSIDSMFEYPVLNDPIMEPYILNPLEMDGTILSPLENVLPQVTYAEVGIQTNVTSYYSWLKTWVKFFFNWGTETVDSLIGSNERVANWAETVEPGLPISDGIQTIVQSPVVTLGDIELFNAVDALYSPTPTVTEVVEVVVNPIIEYNSEFLLSLSLIEPTLPGILFGIG